MNAEVDASQSARLCQSIISACRRLSETGLNQGTSGNISLRDGPTMLITPSATSYEAMRPEDIVKMTIADRDGKWLGFTRPSSEWRFHRDILHARPEIGAVVHAHPPYCTALAIAGREIPPCHYMIVAFGGDNVRVAPYAQYGSQRLSDVALAALQDRTACLLANHGMIALGRNLDEAMWRAQELEALARQYLLSLAAGPPRFLNDSEIAEASHHFGAYREQTPLP